MGKLSQMPAHTSGKSLISAGTVQVYAINTQTPNSIGALGHCCYKQADKNIAGQQKGQESSVLF